MEIEDYDDMLRTEGGLSSSEAVLRCDIDRNLQSLVRFCIWRVLMDLDNSIRIRINAIQTLITGLAISVLGLFFIEIGDSFVKPLGEGVAILGGVVFFAGVFWGPGRASARQRIAYAAGGVTSMVAAILIVGTVPFAESAFTLALVVTLLAAAAFLAAAAAIGHPILWS